ncbi:hypothetical protein QP185_17570 [Sphingomonas aerolata]|uniref:hypothetical protein n=1 Tax=Sphingomonas aerolata TaxID=185951 RepID=UPI002FDF7E0E
MDPATPLVLIGNGTGLAGLMAHLRERARTGGAPAWLLYGERSSAFDRPLAAELDALQAAGTLERDRPRLLARCGLRALCPGAGRGTSRPDARLGGPGAAIYVCGSLVGMAGAVDAELRIILGDDRVEAMSEAGLYRRDIY